MLGLRRLKERHTGEYIGRMLCDIIVEYKFSDSLGVLMADNASENDTAIAAVFSQFLPSLKDTSSRRARCLAHIINLAAKAFLYGSNPSVFEEEVRRLDLESFDEGIIREAQISWRKRGPIGKLHNIITFIRRSATRKEEFRSIGIGDMTVDSTYSVNKFVRCEVGVDT